MRESDRSRLTSIIVAAIAFAVFLPTIQWGLPSRDTDRSLFGDHRPWTGREILELLDRSAIGDQQSGTRGADVDSTPILDRSQPVVLNDTDARRAEIVQRYRLMSKQPDEFIQFKALAEMSQRTGLAKFDPRLYQYGGLWIYPVGALVRGAMLIGYIDSPPAGVPAKEFYLDHPDVFGRFYVVARAYSSMWGIVAAIAITWITRRLTHSHTLAALAAIAFILLPVTRTAAHEAKPHLAGAALCLCAVIAATRYVEGGRSRYALLAGALCGAAMAMVVSMLLSCAVLPVMAWMRWRQVSRQVANASRNGREVVTALLCACVGTLLVYALTNPFLLFNAIFHPEILRSNLGNSTAMYGISGMGAAIASAIRIAIEGMTIAGVILAGLSVVVLIIARLYGCHRSRYSETCGAAGAPGQCSAGTPVEAKPATTCGTPSDVRKEWVSDLFDRGIEKKRSDPFISATEIGGTKSCAAGWILAAPAVCVLIQFVLLAAGKPAEYARFGLVIFASASCLSAWMLSRASKPTPVAWIVVVATLLLTYSIFVPALSKSMQRSLPWMSALVAGDPPDKYGKSAWTLGLSHEPAPWSVMPLNLFRDQLILTKPAADPKIAPYDVYLYPSNLSSQIGRDASAESVDWARNRTRMLLGSLPPRASSTIPSESD